MRAPREVGQRFLRVLHVAKYAVRFDGLHEVEAGAHRAGQDGLHSAWVAYPLEDATSVGLRKRDDKEEPTEVKAPHDGF